MYFLPFDCFFRTIYYNNIQNITKSLENKNILITNLGKKKNKYPDKEIDILYLIKDNNLKQLKYFKEKDTENYNIEKNCPRVRR